MEKDIRLPIAAQYIINTMWNLITLLFHDNSKHFTTF